MKISYLMIKSVDCFSKVSLRDAVVLLHFKKINKEMPKYEIDFFLSIFPRDVLYPGIKLNEFIPI